MKERKILYSLPVKIVCYLLAAAATGTFILCACMMVVLQTGDYFHNGKEQIVKASCQTMLNQEIYRLSNSVMSGFWNLDNQLEDTNLRYELYDKEGEKIAANYDNEAYMLYQELYFHGAGEDQYAEPFFSGYVLRLYLDERLVKMDKYGIISRLAGTLHDNRFIVILAGIGSFLLLQVLLFFLYKLAGQKPGSEKVHEGMFTRIPLEILAFILLVIISLLIFLGLEYRVEEYPVLLGLTLIPLFFLLPACVMGIGVRKKLGILWKNTLIYRFFLPFVRAGKWIGKRMNWIIRKTPQVWRTLLLIFCISSIELVVYINGYWEEDNMMILGTLERLLLFGAAIYLAIILARLLKGSREMAAGNLSSQVNVSKMVWEFKQHGEDLNSIREGMNHAVEERMKIKRLKTELITNVSHDIKTPLTSIINYADLVSKEETDNKNITENARKLYNQSEQLKKLIEGMVEASKATTGNMEVKLEPCEAGVLLTQTVGEYESRLREKNLTLITRQPEGSVKIPADGRLLWKVFDHLMSNVYEHSQSGTRVYLDVAPEEEDKISITFRNTSREELDVSAEEFVERLAREGKTGASSGNGLGLSVARSLTELQNGSFLINIDGDLFKVMLVFQKI